MPSLFRFLTVVAVIGGLISSTLLTLFLLPMLYERFGENPAERAALERARAPSVLAVRDLRDGRREVRACLHQRCEVSWLEGVRVEAFGDEGFDLQIGKRKQADRLLQLWRHDQ